LFCGLDFGVGKWKIGMSNWLIGKWNESEA